MHLQIWKLHDMVTNINRLLLCQLKNVNITLVVIKKMQISLLSIYLFYFLMFLHLYCVLFYKLTISNFVLACHFFDKSSK